jgi:hypothetical protein
VMWLVCGVAVWCKVEREGGELFEKLARKHCTLSFTLASKSKLMFMSDDNTSKAAEVYMASQWPT